MVFSTFLSDLILSLVSLAMAYRFVGKSSIPSRSALYGLAIIGISAGLGSIHFLGINTLDPIYRFFVGIVWMCGSSASRTCIFSFYFPISFGKNFFPIYRRNFSSLLSIFLSLSTCYLSDSRWWIIYVYHSH